MPNTITSYTTFTAGTKARASEVNANFLNHRGTLVPINEDTASASDSTHDLGHSSHQWRNLYLSDQIILAGETVGTLPIGTVFLSILDSAPANCLLIDGSSVARATYDSLFTKMTNGAETSPSFGYETTTHFNLPDGRGKLFRMVDGGAGNDPDAATRTAQGTNGSTGDSIGSIQPYKTALPTTSFTTDNPGNHSHSVTVYNGGVGASDPAAGGSGGTATPSTGGAGSHSHTVNGGGDNQTVGVNFYLKAYIRY